MFEHMDCDDPVKVIVRKRKFLLNIGHQDRDSRKAGPHFLRHIFSQLDCDIFGFLFRIQFFPSDVFTETCSDFQRSLKRDRRMSHDISMIPAICEPQLCRKDFMPVAHEIVINPLSLYIQRRQNLWPLAHPFTALGLFVQSADGTPQRLQ